MQKRIRKLLVPFVGASLVAGAGMLWPSSAEAFGWGGSPCKKNASAGYRSCREEIQEEFWEAVGNCVFESDLDEVAGCLADALDTGEAKEECRDVYDARIDICRDLPGAYDPPFDPATFDDDFSSLTNPNPYYPVGIGYAWHYETEDEAIAIDIRAATKLIEGVTCITAHDEASEEGVVVESTDDWLAVALDGSVHYCGEISLNFELFEGDDPEVPELVDIDGSWKAGRDDAKQGVLMQAVPAPGSIYRQEWAFGEAEDMAQVLSNSYSYGNGEGLDFNVPEELAEHFCENENCVVTRDFTPLEPGVEERKYYARGVGLFLEVGQEEGDFVPLVDCNFHPLCDDIPDVGEDE